MGVLSDRSILAAVQKGEIIVSPWDTEVNRIQPASLDVRLGSHFKTFNCYKDPSLAGVIRPASDDAPEGDYIDLSQDNSDRWNDVYIDAENRRSQFCLLPGEFCLATTLETVKLPPDVRAKVEGKSSLGRYGLAIHVTAGFIDPGFTGQITLELYNHLSVAMWLTPGMPIAQLEFARLDRAAMTAYKGKYQGQVGATSSQMHQNFLEPSGPVGQTRQELDIRFGPAKERVRGARPDDEVGRA